MRSIIYESDNNDFQIIDLKKEYRGYREDIRYAIVTDLSEAELHKIYEDVIGEYSPFIIITVEMLCAMEESFANDERERWRDRYLHDVLSVEAAMFLVDELSNPVRISESVFNMEIIIARMKELPNNAGKRMYKKYIIGFTAREIAKQEGISFEEVRKSIYRAKPELHKVFVELGVVA
jgi:hypothetical protein